MKDDDLVQRCRKAVLEIAKDVKDINLKMKDLNFKMNYFLENYREDYYQTRDALGYRREFKG